MAPFNRNQRSGRKGPTSKGRTNRPSSRPSWPSRPPRTSDRTETSDDGAIFVERKPKADAPFRVVIAVHRPRYRGRVERACAVPDWDVTSLLNKQDPVGLVQKGGVPPDLVILSSDFGRQKTLGIFRAIQPERESGMIIVGMVEDPEDDAAIEEAAELCDHVLSAPYRTPDLRALIFSIYEDIRGEPVNLPLTEDTGEEDEESDS